MVVRITVALSLINLFAFCRSADSRKNASDARCEFGPGQNLGRVVNSPVFDGSPTVSADETELLFTSARHPSAPRGQQDIFVATRPNATAAWGKPIDAGGMINDSLGDDFSLRLSSDGKALYYASNRTGGFGKGDMYVATRTSRGDPWSRAVNLGPVLNTDAFEAFPTPSADGLTLYFNRSTTFDSPDSDIWASTRTSPDGQWTSPRKVSGGINSDRAEFSPALSADGNTMYFASERGGSVELWVAKRADRGSEWRAPKKLAAVNTPLGMTLAPFLSNDQRSLYFMSARPDTGDTACTPMTCFDRLDLYVAKVSCRR